MLIIFETKAFRSQISHFLPFRKNWEEGWAKFLSQYLGESSRNACFSFPIRCLFLKPEC